ncbi:kunitz-type serine protease inhibitor IX-like [Babylonia areolata]|uniref:kunitz-type serine protease inhibitor IX-like n=1 Tax=Babylonia areolata TaxID=304850 RepID=UPI003FCF16ED
MAPLTFRKSWFFVMFLITVLLTDYTVQSRFCWPPCEWDERCVATKPKGQWSFFNNICIPKRCFFRPRRGRCRHFRHPYHFHPGSMKCVRDSSGACYGRRNRFTTMEDCELTCLHRFNR